MMMKLWLESSIHQMILWSLKNETFALILSVLPTLSKSWKRNFSLSKIAHLHSRQSCQTNHYESQIFNHIIPIFPQSWQHCYFKSSLITEDKDVIAIAKLLYDLHLKFHRALLKSKTCLEFTRTLLELSFID